jgi:ATP-dependent protease Clp ATPase subunit
MTFEPDPMKTVACSFCGTAATLEEARTRFVAGPTVFICRDCVGLTIEIFTDQDPQWGERKIKDIEAILKTKRHPLR